MQNEIVYALTNPAMPGLVKIGKTTQSDIKSRMNQLYTTGVPVPFDCIFAVKVNDCSKVESALHIAFGPYRINPNREFFKIEPEQVISILKILGDNDFSSEINTELHQSISQAEIDSAKNLNRRPRLNFTEMNIPKGSILFFRDDDTEIEVVNSHQIKFNGELMSLTAATREKLGIDYSVKPTPYWIYKGKLLEDIYNETYSYEEE